MGVILGKVVLKCPKKGKEVVLHEDCMNADGEGNSCVHFKHYGIEGSKIAVTCTAAP